MLQCYVRKTELFYNGNGIHTETEKVLREEVDKNFQEVETIDWGNVEEKTRWMFYPPFHCWNSKKGKKLIFNESSSAIKEWKEPNLKMELVITYKPYTPTLKEIFNFPADKAMQYLKEQNTQLSAEMIKEGIF